MQNRDYRLKRLKPNFSYKSYKFKWFCKNSQIGKILYSADSFMRAWLCAVLPLMQSGIMSPKLWTSHAVQVNTIYKNCCAKYSLFTIIPFNTWSGLRRATAAHHFASTSPHCIWIKHAQFCWKAMQENSAFGSKVKKESQFEDRKYEWQLKPS